MGRREGSQQRVHGALVRDEVIICLVTDRRQLSPAARTPRDEVSALISWLDESIAAGVDLIQLRERDLSGRLQIDLARAVTASAAGSDTRVMINDRADIALACGCDGVHLRGDGPPVDRVRDCLALEDQRELRTSYVARPGSHGRDRLIGRSVHSAAEARLHRLADYLILGAVFGSGPKPGLGLDALREVAGVASQVIAIGGITVARAAECIAAGASGVAAIRLFLPPGRAAGALGVPEATRQLRGAIEQ